jgi:hypothetical protein
LNSHFCDFRDNRERFSNTHGEVAIGMSARMRQGTFYPAMQRF